jgi:hypothetical protein
MTKQKPRNHSRAEGKAQTSISLRRDLLEAAKEAAEQDNRSLSNWLEIILKEKLDEAKSSTSDQTEEVQN